MGELEARLDNLRAVLPEEKDVGDLLRRIQTLATQSNLQIKGFKPAPIVTRQMHAEWPINLELDGTYHNLGVFFDRVSKFSRIINVGRREDQGEGQAGARIDHRRGVHGDDLRADRTETRTGGAGHSRGAGGACEGELTMTTFVLLGRADGAGAGAGAAPRRRHRPRPVARAGRASTATPTTPRGGAIRSSACCAAGRTSAATRTGAGVDGLSGLSVDEISVRGVVAGRNGYVAMVMGPDNKTYLVRPNDKLLDGTVKAVTAQGLVILQEVNDPLSLVKQKEVRKMLRALEEGK